MAKRKRRASAHKKKSKRGTRTTRRKKTSKRGKSRTRAKPAPLRTIEFHEPTAAHIVRDKLANVRTILHAHKPLSISAKTILDAAKNYLLSHCKHLGLQPDELQKIDHPPEYEPTEAGVEYRLIGEKRQFNLSTVTYQQTVWGLPVWESAIAVHVKDYQDSSFRIVGAQMGRHEDLKPSSISKSADSIKRVGAIDAETLAESLGIAHKSRKFDAKSLRIAHQSLVIYRYNAKKRWRTMPLPRVPAGIVDGSFNVVSAVYFDISRKHRSSTQWLALVEAKSLSVLYLQELAAGLNGLVFPADPETLNGGPTSTGSDKKLNPLRVSEPLSNLTPSNPQKLSGTNVEIINFELPDNVVPTVPPGAAFDFNARTDAFAAVNAYYNCNRFFEYIRSLGFSLADYFPNQTFPIKVDARGWVGTEHSPNTANAQTRPKTRHAPDGSIVGEVENVVFQLADAGAPTRPLGIACDWRVVLHELGGHATLVNHVADTMFGFAHSAGDSFAAILNDPTSKAKKGRTFPWVFNQVGFDRRHDRKPSQNPANDWSWDGPIDRADRQTSTKLCCEQILSSTHFRFYQAIGGADTHLNMRTFAADYTIYLILLAIKGLRQSSNPQCASEWLGHLQAADAADWTSRGQAGGAYFKVLHWAFEKQGLFGGKPPDVDVYIDDGRKGEYTYNPDYAKCPAIWNRNQADDKEGHQAPIPNTPNFAYVKIKNRGSSVAKSVTVDAFQANAGSALVYPGDWKKMNTPQLVAPDIPGRSMGTKVGPFRWIPNAGSNAILMAVSAPDDLNNLSNFTARDTIPDWRLVPNDNNLGMRKV